MKYLDTLQYQHQKRKHHDTIKFQRQTRDLCMRLPKQQPSLHTDFNSLVLERMERNYQLEGASAYGGQGASSLPLTAS